MSETSASFTIDLQSGEPALDGTARFDFTKTWTGGLTGRGVGVMLSAGDPQSGQAGYVALETFNGTIDGRTGTVAFQQFGVMSGAGEPSLDYVIVPGSGTGDLVGITGTIHLDVVDGDHQVTLTYEW